jgi:hypothetical protein
MWSMKIKNLKLLFLVVFVMSFVKIDLANALIIDPQVIATAIAASGATGDTLLKTVAVFNALKAKNIYIYVPTFTRNLYVGVQDGRDIVVLKKLLNLDPATTITSSSYNTVYTATSTQRYDVETKAAVIKFQEKYASEILAPLNLTRGTGFVGSSTRVKLNKMDYDYDMALLGAGKLTSAVDKNGKTVNVGMVRNSSGQISYSYIDSTTGLATYRTVDPISGVSTSQNTSSTANSPVYRGNTGQARAPSVIIPSDLSNTTDVNSYIDNLKNQYLYGQSDSSNYLGGQTTDDSGFKVVLSPGVAGGGSSSLNNSAVSTGLNDYNNLSVPGGNNSNITTTYDPTATTDTGSMSLGSTTFTSIVSNNSSNFGGGTINDYYFNGKISKIAPCKNTSDSYVEISSNTYGSDGGNKFVSANMSKVAIGTEVFGTASIGYAICTTCATITGPGCFLTGRKVTGMYSSTPK